MNQQPLRRRGFLPTLTDEEVITMEICGEYFGFSQEEDLYNYFSAHYAHFFPALRGRTSFVRQSANLWKMKALIQERLTYVRGEAHDPVQIIDTMPLPVCTYTRARRDRCFPCAADFGYCAAKDMHYYGFKLGLRVSRVGMIIHYPLLSARPHDSQFLDDLLDGFEGVAPADKGFVDAFRQTELARKRHVELVTPARKNMKVQPPVAVRLICRRWRKPVETVASHLTERFHIAIAVQKSFFRMSLRGTKQSPTLQGDFLGGRTPPRNDIEMRLERTYLEIYKTRAHDLWHYQNRLIRKVLAHTVCVFLNLQLGRPPLDLDGLVTA